MGFYSVLLGLVLFGDDDLSPGEYPVGRNRRFLRRWRSMGAPGGIVFTVNFENEEFGFYNRFWGSAFEWLDFIVRVK